MSGESKLKEWWSIERESGPGKWIGVVWDDERHADRASADMMARDESILCIHRERTRPETERPESAFK